jgi:hypothetical protein
MSIGESDEYKIAFAAVCSANNSSDGWVDSTGFKIGFGSEFFFEHPIHGIWYVFIDRENKIAIICKKYDGITTI